MVIGDLHGQTPQLPDEEVDAVLVIGDVCADTGMREYMNQSLQLYNKEGPEADTWYEIAGEEKATQLVHQSLQAGRDTMKLLNKLGVPVYAIPGNWDWTGEDSEWELITRNLWSERVVADLENVIDLDDSLLETDEYSLLGYGRVNGPELLEHRGYEFVTDEEIAENQQDFQELYEAFATLCKEAQHPIIFLSHNVPYDTELDIINNPESIQDGKHFGSILARKIIDEYQPVLCVAGHIHEHYKTQKIGNTVCLNAGFGADKVTIITIEDGTVDVQLNT